MKMKKNLFLLFYVLAGIVLGALIANVCGKVPGLSWLAFSNSIGFSPSAPAVLDLSVIKISFGFSMGISVAQILTIGGALFLYFKTAGR